CQSPIGHTDNVGTEYRNQKLSVRRAKACFDYLTSKGISPSRMNYGGFGQTKPVANNDTEDGRSQNRRVEFDLYLK
ncbi:MAG: OmpA family protein, partial [Bacteroidota bacterium]